MALAFGHWDIESAKRMFWELRRLHAYLPEGFDLKPMKDLDLSLWLGKIPGPIGTPYEGGKFVVVIEIPPGYPFSAPLLRFATKIWHPNVSREDGSTCLFQDDFPCIGTLSHLLIWASALISAPDPADPYDTIVAEQFVNDHEAFCATAREWTQKHAISSDDRVFNEFEREYPIPEGWGEGEDGETVIHVEPRSSRRRVAQKRLERVQMIVDERSQTFSDGDYLELMTELKSLYDDLT